jgi:hypothetical protein
MSYQENREINRWKERKRQVILHRADLQTKELDTLLFAITISKVYLQFTV